MVSSRQVLSRPGVWAVPAGYGGCPHRPRRQLQTGGCHDPDGKAGDLMLRRRESCLGEVVLDQAPLQVLALRAPGMKVDLPRLCIRGSGDQLAQDVAPQERGGQGPGDRLDARWPPSAGKVGSPQDPMPNSASLAAMAASSISPRSAARTSSTAC